MKPVANLNNRISNYAIVPPSDCWLWLGVVVDGYGKVNIKTPKGWRMRNAHRVSFEISKGAVPVGMELDHLCRVRCCVNPHHLEPVPHRENVLRGDAPKALKAANDSRQRATHCKRGHKFMPENIESRKEGWRRCRACRRERRRSLKFGRV